MPSNPDQDGRNAGAPQHPRGDDLLETVFEQAPLGMVLFDAGLVIFRANAALADIMGSTPERLVGRSIVDTDSTAS